MAQTTTSYVIQGSTKGFAEASRAVAATNKTIKDSQDAQLKSAKELAAALGLIKEKAEKTSKAISDVSGGSKSVPSGFSANGTAAGAASGKRSRPTGDLGSVLDALGKFATGGARQKLQEMSAMFHKLRLDALGAAEAINTAGTAMSGAGMGGGRYGGGPRDFGRPPNPPGGGGSGSGAGDGGKGSGTRPRRRHAGEGAFLQGFLEGVLPQGLGRVLQRGPGVIAQAGGQMVGGFVRSAAAVPFNGAAGIPQLMSQVPGVGGSMGALTSRAMAQVGSAVSQAQQTQSLNPYLGRAGRAYAPRLHFYDYRDSPESIRAQKARDAMLRAQEGMVQPMALSQTGLLHGKDFGETQSFAAQLAAGSGRIYSTGRNTRSLNTSLALANVYGISAGTLGTYNRMANYGLSGSGMQGALADVSRAYAMGLGKPDIAQYLDATAAGNEQYQRTGFRPDPRQIGNIGSSLAGIGVTGRRAETGARGLEGRVQDIGMAGPQGGLELMLMQELGYTGGLESGAKIMRQMRSGNLGDQGGRAVMRVLQKVSRMSGGGDLGHFAALRAAKSLNLPLNDEDIGRIESNAGNSSFGLTRKIGRLLAADVVSESEASVDPITRRAKLSQNQNLDIGSRMAENVQVFEKSVDNLTQGISTAFVPALNKASGALEYFTQAAIPAGPAAMSSATQAQAVTSPTD